jgi:hypothetical protein
MPTGRSRSVARQPVREGRPTTRTRPQAASFKIIHASGSLQSRVTDGQARSGSSDRTDPLGEQSPKSLVRAVSERRYP